MFRSYPRSIWSAYKSYIESVIQVPPNDLVQDIEYWQKKLFSSGVLYALPLTLLILIPCVYIEIQFGSMVIAGVQLIATTIFAFIALAPQLSLNLRKTLLVFMVACISIALELSYGEFSMGSIYLFSLSAFVALVYSNTSVYMMVAFNFLVFASFAIAIRFHLFGLHQVINTPFDRWIVYSLNFMMMNLIVAMLIRKILNGLNQTMRKEAILFKKLQKELEQSATLNLNLQASKEDYKTLFFCSPNPKLIFDMQTLQILQVNSAACQVYGYTEQEFLDLKLPMLYPEHWTAAELPDHTSEPYRTEHIGKGGKYIHTELRHRKINFKGKKAGMIISTDIGQQLQFTNAIQEQNAKLREIAYIQSHVIRVPLARIMSISEVIGMEYNGVVDVDLLNYLNISASELDVVIRDVVNKSAEALAGD